MTRIEPAMTGAWPGPQWDPAIGPPCRAACPTDKDIPGFLRAIARGDPAQAWRIAYRDNLFPGVLGWICPHPCESACRLGVTRGAAVPVCDLKRWLTATHAPPDDLGFPPAGDGPAVAVIGAGPAGLSAAHDLAVAGGRVTLFDRDQRPGGLLVGCIPAFRLPPRVAESDIERVLSLGVRFEPGFDLREARQLEALMGELGFAAVLLATGGGDDREPELPGYRPSAAIRTAIAFLRDAREGTVRLEGLGVVVVGGGNGAIDSARTALRLGAKEVSILYRRGREDMPAFPDGIEAAEREGIEIHPWMVVTEIVWRGETLGGVRCAATGSGGVPGSRRAAAPLALPGTHRFRSCDSVVFAIGQQPTLPSDLADIPGVFTCAGAPSGAGTVVDAIASGRRAAARLIEALERAGVWRAGKGVAAVRGPNRAARLAEEGGANGDARLRDARGANGAPAAPGDGCRFDRALADLFHATEAASHAARCLACDHILALDTRICVLCGKCEERCAFEALAWRPADNGSWRLTVSDADCQRCGDCVAACPSGALTWKPWTLPNRIHTNRAIVTTSPAGAFSRVSAGEA